MNKRNITFEDSYINALKDYSFPGNIRELKNIIERSIILETSNVLTADSLPQIEIGEEKPCNHSGTFNLAEVEKNAVMGALEKCNNSQKEAAKLLGLSESAVSRKIKKYR
jgi:transcriptional regulator with PAS, ATPase and Fis domain